MFDNVQENIVMMGQESLAQACETREVPAQVGAHRVLLVQAVKDGPGQRVELIDVQPGFEPEIGGVDVESEHGEKPTQVKIRTALQNFPLSLLDVDEPDSFDKAKGVGHHHRVERVVHEEVRVEAAEAVVQALVPKLDFQFWDQEIPVQCLTVSNIKLA